jgi:hypothetical protein
MYILLTGADGNLDSEIRRQAQAPVVRLGREGQQDLDTLVVVWTLLQHLVKYSHPNIGTGIATKIATIVELVAQQFSNLVRGHSITTEAEYARADMSKLNEYWSRDFIQIDAYANERFRPKDLSTDKSVPVR